MTSGFWAAVVDCMQAAFFLLRSVSPIANRIPMADGRVNRPWSMTKCHRRGLLARSHSFLCLSVLVVAFRLCLWLVVFLSLSLSLSLSVYLRRTSSLCSGTWFFSVAVFALEIRLTQPSACFPPLTFPLSVRQQSAPSLSPMTSSGRTSDSSSQKTSKHVAVWFRQRRRVQFPSPKAEPNRIEYRRLWVSAELCRSAELASERLAVPLSEWKAAVRQSVIRNFCHKYHLILYCSVVLNVMRLMDVWRFTDSLKQFIHRFGFRTQGVRASYATNRHQSMLTQMIAATIQCHCPWSRDHQ